MVSLWRAGYGQVMIRSIIATLEYDNMKREGEIAGSHARGRGKMGRQRSMFRVEEARWGGWVIISCAAIE